MVLSSAFVLEVKSEFGVFLMAALAVFSSFLFIQLLEHSSFSAIGCNRLHRSLLSSKLVVVFMEISFGTSALNSTSWLLHTLFSFVYKSIECLTFSFLKSWNESTSFATTSNRLGSSAAFSKSVPCSMSATLAFELHALLNVILLAVKNKTMQSQRPWNWLVNTTILSYSGLRQ